MHFALDYLGSQIRLNAGEVVAAPVSARGRRVLVIGGGDTGSDCVGTALRQGAREVHQIEVVPQPPERRAPDNPWPAWPRLLRTTTSHAEGCFRQWGVQTDWLEGAEGQVVRWHGRDAATGEELSREVDLVVLALGFLHADPQGVMDPLGLETDGAGNLRARPGGGMPGVFVAGDAAHGASLVVRAIKSGRQIAQAVDRFLLG